MTASADVSADDTAVFEPTPALVVDAAAVLLLSLAMIVSSIGCWLLGNPAAGQCGV